MKSLLVLALTIFLSVAYANRPDDTATTGSPAQTGSATGTYSSEAPPANDTSGSDTVGTAQSSTSSMRDTDKLNRRRGHRNYSNGTTTNCVDREGHTYGPNDTGFSACRDSMRK
jgi:hypothetical protein